MNRYQIYLDPKTVSSLDGLASNLDLSRSQIIRDVVDRVVREYEKIINAKMRSNTKNNPLLKMAGFGKSPTGKVSISVDEIYDKD